MFCTQSELCLGLRVLNLPGEVSHGRLVLRILLDAIITDDLVSFEDLGLVDSSKDRVLGQPCNFQVLKALSLDVIRKVLLHEFCGLVSDRGLSGHEMGQFPLRLGIITGINLTNGQLACHLTFILLILLHLSFVKHLQILLSLYLLELLECFNKGSSPLLHI